VRAVARDAHVAGATPFTRPCSSNRISAAAKPGKISTPSSSALPASQRHRLPRLPVYVPLLCRNGGVHRCGSVIFFFGDSTQCRFSVTGTSASGQSSRQSGSSSSRLRGSITAPDRMCAPTSDPFSSTQTLRSAPFSAATCLKRIAADRPAGPAPTITTS